MPPNPGFSFPALACLAALPSPLVTPGFFPSPRIPHPDLPTHGHPLGTCFECLAPLPPLFSTIVVCYSGSPFTPFTTVTPFTPLTPSHPLLAQLAPGLPRVRAALIAHLLYNYPLAFRPEFPSLPSH